jgi:hypothetical protein
VGSNSTGGMDVCVIDKNGQVVNYTVQRRLHVWFEVTVRRLQIRCRDTTSEDWESWSVWNGEL